MKWISRSVALLSICVLQAAEPTGLPVQLRYHNGEVVEGELLSWKGEELKLKGQSHSTEGLRAILLGEGEGFAFTHQLDEQKEGWDFSHIRLSKAVWKEEEGWWFSNAFTRRLRYEIPKGGRLPMQVECTVEFSKAKAGYQLYIYPMEPANVGRAPNLFFKIHQGMIYCGSNMTENGISHRFPLPKDRQGPWNVRMLLDPERNQYQVFLNGEALVRWKEKDGLIPADQSFAYVDGVITVKDPVTVKHFEISLNGGAPNEKDRKPPYVELSNGDLLPMTGVGLDERGFLLQMEGADPIPVPKDGVLSLWFPKP